MDISQSTFTMTEYLMAQMNDAVNALMKRSSYMNHCLYELNVLRVFADNHGFDFAVGGLLGHKDLSVYFAANMEAFSEVENELLTTFGEETDWYMEYEPIPYTNVTTDDLPALFDEYILQKSFIAMSPVGQGQQLQINIFMFAK